MKVLTLLFTWTLACCTSVGAVLSSVEQARMNWTLVLLPRHLAVPLLADCTWKQGFEAQLMTGD